MNEMSFHHAAISVPNLDEAIDWYRQILGYEVEKSFNVPPVPARAAMIRRGNMRVEIFEVRDGEPLPAARREPIQDLKTHGNKHVAYVVPDFEDALEQMRDKGVEVVFVVRQEVGSGFFVRDPAGNLIEFVDR